MQAKTVISADGTELAARCSGSGSPVVLVHGAMGSLDSFVLIEGLLAERHAVWVYSRRGRVGSGDGPGYGLDREIEDVLAVLDVAGDGAHLLGHSSGASYCLMAAPRARSLRSLVLYEPPLHVDRVDAALLDAAQSALDVGDPDRAIELFCPVADIVEQEVDVLRTLEPAWERMREGVLMLPRELRALRVDGRALLSAVEPPDVPTLYLYGEDTDSASYPTLDEVAELMPKAQLQCLPGQRHLAPAFDPTTFAQAVLDFTTAHDD